MKNVVTDFGADPTGTTDSTSAIQSGINSTIGILFFPAGTYLVSSTLVISNPCLTLLGEGKKNSILSTNMTNTPTIQIQGVNYINIRDLGLNKTVTATTGADGISSESYYANICSIDEVEIENHFCGMNLGCTGYSYVTRCFIHDNYSHGIYISNGAMSNPCQWTIKDTLCQVNDGCGLLIQSGATPISVGEINNFSTFGNGESGIAAIGSSGAGVYGLRIMGGLLGGDNSHGLYLNTYAGFPHKINGIVIEAVGSSSSGRGASIPPSYTGYGIYITTENTEVLLSNVIARQNSLSGMYMGNGIVNAVCSDFSYNGQANVVGNMSGIYVGGGRLLCNSNVVTGNQFGLVLVNDNHIITSNSLSGNSIGPYYNSVPLTNTKYANNLT